MLVPGLRKFGTLGSMVRLVVPSKKESRRKKLKVKMNLKLHAIGKSLELTSQCLLEAFSQKFSYSFFKFDILLQSKH
jgi:hypothetical protein